MPARFFATPMKWICLLVCLALGAPAARSQTPGDFSGKVVETTNAASYTYVLVDTGSAKLWAAAPQFEVKPGDVVTVGGGMPMENYHSKTLNRDFAVVYFTGSVKVNDTTPGDAGKTVELPPNHPSITGSVAKPAVDLSGIKKATGGKTVAEIFAGMAKLNGKPVKVRGKVVKYNAQILGKNWIHIQDGTGTPGSNDLTVTTATEAKIGDTILVSGIVHTDRDFGAGYKYSVIIEDATVTSE